MTCAYMAYMCATEEGEMPRKYLRCVSVDKQSIEGAKCHLRRRPVPVHTHKHFQNMFTPTTI